MQIYGCIVLYVVLLRETHLSNARTVTKLTTSVATNMSCFIVPYYLPIIEVVCFLFVRIVPHRAKSNISVRSFILIHKYELNI